MKVIEKNNIIPENNGSVFSVERIRKDFPILERIINGQKIVYLDSAATTQKPYSVIDSISSYYYEYNANVHRGLHTLAEEATTAMEVAFDPGVG